MKRFILETKLKSLMHVWIITVGEPLPNQTGAKKMRSSILADKLIEKGCKITFFASAFNHVNKKWIYDNDRKITINESMNLFVIKGIGYKKNISIARFIDHRLISKKFKKIVNSKEIELPDIIVVSSPPYDLAYNAVQFGKLNNIPVLVDVRDEWPELFLNKFPSYLKKLIKPFLAKEFYLFKRAITDATGIVSMMESLLHWALQYANRKRKEEDTVFYLGGNKIMSNESKKDFFKTSATENKFIVTFAGTFVDNNNPSILIECSKSLKDKNIYFILAGDGEMYSHIFSKGKDLSNVKFTGWLNETELYSLIHSSHVCVSPSPDFRKAFPNKIFSYLANGKPVLTSFQGDLKEIIEKYNIGFYYPPNNVVALTNYILKLCNDQDLYEQMSQNARKVFEEMFDADKIYSEYANHVINVANDYKNKK